MVGLFTVYEFRPVVVPVVSRFVLEEIVRCLEAGREFVEVTLDLGLSRARVEVRDGYVYFPNSSISIDEVRSVLEDCDETDLYAVLGDRLVHLSLATEERYYKLRCVGPETAPTLEISGIHMHRICGISPWEDSMSKVAAARVRPCCRVLDVCTGLGYTAIGSLRRGACHVVTIEKDVNVLKIAEYNPWSRELASSRVTVILGDACEVVKYLEDSSFDRIIHDPPRFSLAGELYSTEFYRELYRVLKPGGFLYHYVGYPGAKYRRLDVMSGVVKRLRIVGFDVWKVDEVWGVVARKRR